MPNAFLHLFGELLDHKTKLLALFGAVALFCLTTPGQ
jgi:hypothetical protein